MHPPSSSAGFPDPFAFISSILDPDAPDQPPIQSRLEVLLNDVFRERDTFTELANYNGG
jgi:hypothetical protein